MVRGFPPAYTSDRVAVGRVLDPHRVLDQTLELKLTVSGTAPVETKRVLVPVVGKMLMAHSSLVRSAEPAFEPTFKDSTQHLKHIRAG